MATVVQSQASNFADGNAGHVVTFSQNATAGNLLVLTVNSDTIVSTPSGWTLPTNGSRVGGQGAYLFYKFASGSETSVTVTTSGNNATSFGFVEYSGIAAFDVATNVGVDGTGATSTPSITLTAAGAGELQVFMACLHGIGAAGTSPSWSGGVTQFLDSGLNATSPGVQQFFGHIVTGSTTSTTTVASWSTNIAADRYTIAAAFTLAADVPATPPTPQALPGLTWQRRFQHRQQQLPLAPSAGPSTDAPAEAATGTGSAFDVQADIGANSAAATGTGTAQDPTVAVTVPAEAASGTGSAPDPLAALGANAEAASGTGTASDAQAAITVNAETATGTGAALDATVSTAAQTNAPAEVATGTGTAPDPLAAITVNAEAATGIGSALDATVSTTSQTNAPAEVATGTGTALDPTTTITVPAGPATGTGTAPNATVQIGTEAPAGSASGTGSAFNASIAVTVNAEAAAGAGVATNATGALIQPFTIGALAASSTSAGAGSASSAAIGDLRPSSSRGGPS